MRNLLFVQILCAIALLPFPVLAIDNTTLQKIEERLQKTPRILGRFIQEKKLPHLPMSLKSKGVVAISDKRGISWRVVEPLESHLILSEENSGSDALTRKIAYPLMQIFRGNFARLEQLFEVKAKLLDGHWQVTLTPKSRVLSGFMESIEISGADTIDHIRLAEINKAVTEMRLIELRPVSENDPQFIAEFEQR